VKVKSPQKQQQQQQQAATEIAIEAMLQATQISRKNAETNAQRSILYQH